MSSFPIYHPADNWKIYYDAYRDGKFHHSGVYWKSYKHKSSAVRAAKQQFDSKIVYVPDCNITYTWTVGQTKPEKVE